MNVADLRGKSEKELREELLALQRGVNPDAVRNDQITRVRKNIARVKTVMNENRGGTAS